MSKLQAPFSSTLPDLLHYLKAYRHPQQMQVSSCLFLTGLKKRGVSQIWLFYPFHSQTHFFSCKALEKDILEVSWDQDVVLIALEFAEHASQC